MRMIPRPDAASSEMIRWTSTLAPMSMPRVGSSRISSRRLRGQPLGQDDLLLVAARQRADELVDAGHPDVELLGVLVARPRAPSTASHQEPREEPRQDRQRHVLGDREVEDEALLVAVLGQVGDPGVHRRRRAGEGRRARRRAGPRRRRAGRCRTGPGRPPSGRPRRARRSPTISPARTEKLTSRKTPARVRPVDLEQDVADRRLDLREQRHGPADHVPDEVGRGQLARRRS